MYTAQVVTQELGPQLVTAIRELAGGALIYCRCPLPIRLSRDCRIPRRPSARTMASRSEAPSSKSRM